MTQKARVHEINFYSNSGHSHAVLGCDWGVFCLSWGLSLLSLLVCFFVVFSVFPAGRLAHLACAGFSSLSLCVSLSRQRYFQHAHRNNQMLAHVSKRRIVSKLINIFIVFALMFQELFVSQVFGCGEKHVHVES